LKNHKSSRRRQSQLDLHREVATEAEAVTNGKTVEAEVVILAKVGVEEATITGEAMT